MTQSSFFCRESSTSGRPVRKGDRIDMADRLTDFARQLRKNATFAEAVLWKELRSRQCEGVKFRRQWPIHGYIVDFVSLERRLIIELDGGQHAEDGEKDLERDSVLQQSGFTVLRFWNNEVLENVVGVTGGHQRGLLESAAGVVTGFLSWKRCVSDLKRPLTLPSPTEGRGNESLPSRQTTNPLAITPLLTSLRPAAGFTTITSPKNTRSPAVSLSPLGGRGQGEGALFLTTTA